MKALPVAPGSPVKTALIFKTVVYAGYNVNSKGNQCALKTQSYSPCIMEIDDQEIDWSKCVYNSDKDFEKVENGKEVSKLEIKVYPLEDGQTTLKGISFRDWAKMLGVEFKLFSPNI